MNKYSCKFCWDRATEQEIKDHLKIVIESNVKWNGPCLDWIGYQDKDGYGRIRFYKKYVHVTRIVWYLKNNQMPDDLVVCHKCDRPCCVNIDCLFLGTVKDNTIDAFEKGRRSGRKGSASNWVKLTEFQVKEIKKMLIIKISQSEIAKKFNVSRGAICDISRGRNWKHVGE